VELEIDVGVALAAKDLHKAETLLAEWKEVDPDGAQFHARTTEHARLVRDARLGEAGLAFDSAITVIVAKHGATANNLAIAEEQLNELQALDPADPNIARRSKQFADARRRVMDTLIVTARRSIDRQGWFDAMSALDGAQKVAPDDPRVPQLRKEMEHQQETAQRDQERRLDARDGPYWLIQATCPLGNGADHTTNVMALRAKLQNNALSRFCLEEVCHPEAGDVDGRVNDQCKRDCLSGKVPHRGRGDRCRLSVKRGDCELATTRDYNCVQR
jgi:hypothetical protein